MSRFHRVWTLLPFTFIASLSAYAADNYPHIERRPIAVSDVGAGTFQEKCDRELSDAKKELKREGYVIWDTQRFSKSKPEDGTLGIVVWNDDCAIYYTTPEALANSKIGTIYSKLKDRTFRNPWNAKETFKIKLKTEINAEDNGSGHITYTPYLTAEPINYSFSSPAIKGEIRLGEEHLALETDGIRVSNGSEASYAAMGLDDKAYPSPIDIFSEVAPLACGQIKVDKDQTLTSIQGSYEESSKQRNYKQTGSINIDIFDRSVRGQNGEESDLWLSYTPKAHIAKSWGYYYWLPDQHAECKAAALQEVKH